MLGPAFTDGYEAQSQIREDIRNGDLLKSLETFWKKVTRGEWDWLPVDIIRSSGVHGGKLSNVKEVRDYNETHLYLDISSDLKAPLYIRGYVGSNYTGSGWRELSDKQNEEGLDPLAQGTFQEKCRFQNPGTEIPELAGKFLPEAEFRFRHLVESVFF